MGLRRAGGLLLALLSLPGGAAADCSTPAGTRSTTVVHVVDGDTLVIDGGRKLRLIGIDAPEVGREERPDEPHAAAARAALTRLIRKQGNRIRYLPGREARDRYGRLLAHAYGAGGDSLAEHLLREGLAYHTVVPPNDRFLDCYRSAEESARERRRGLWSAPALEAERLPAALAGFERVAGRVRAVRTRRGATSIDLDGALVLRIQEADAPRFDPGMLKALPGQRVEVRGWVYRHRGEPRIRLRDPSALRAERQ
jgi:endonuclease YncB( thermonuclease family)